MLPCKLIFLVTLGVVIMSATTAQAKLYNLTKLEKFVDDLPDMPKITGFDFENGVTVPKTLEIGMFPKKWKFHRDLPPTRVFAYGTSKRTATVPGPTIEVLNEVDTYVTWRNHLPKKHILPWDPTIPTAIPADKTGIPTVVHLHGAIGEPQSDGHATSWFTAGFQQKGPTWTKETYHYHNHQQPGNLWYHDHAMGLTRVNILAGLAGSYIIRDPKVEDPLGLPRGDEFDRPLVIFDRAFRTDGSLYMNSTGDNPSIHPQWQPEYFGGAIIVNGKAWPRMVVRRRKYRFRIINASNARFFRFFFSNGLRFIHVGSDSAYHDRPVVLKEFLLAPSEIADVIVDFSESNASSVILGNDAVYPFPSGDPVDEDNGVVMKFFINKKEEYEVDPSRVPRELIKYPSADLSSASETRYITMYEYESESGNPVHLYLNAKPFEEPVTEFPKVGTSEVWYVINLTEDNHPLHIHLGLFRVLNQTKLVEFDEFKACMFKYKDAGKCQIKKHAIGKRVKVAAQEQGWKNVFKMMPGYVTKILVRFSYIQKNASYAFDATAEPGYVYHCHILDHEDNVMMRPMKLIS